ncbi:MAG: Ig-like domain repeat protein [Euryarchaeota archaeon]
MGIKVTSGIVICGHGTVTASIGTVSSGGNDCFYTAYLDVSSLNPGTYPVTLSYSGDSTYQPSQSTTRIEVTA